MANDNPVYNYDQLGRLTQVVWPSGALASFNYDKMGNRTTVVESAAIAPPGPTLPTVTALPKRSQSDFKNDPMMVLLSTGEIAGWGDNTTGVLANGIIAATNSLAQRALFDPNTTVPPEGANIVDWAFTNANLYVVYDNGWVYSAGDNSYGQLGHGDTTDRPYLKRIEFFVTNTLTVQKVWAQGGYSTTAGGGCVFFSANDTSGNFPLYGCGFNTTGCLGINSTVNQTTPVTNTTIDKTAASHVVDVKMSAGGANINTFLLFNSGKVFVAGWNPQGQLGVNTTTNVTTGFTAALNSSSVAFTTAAAISVNAGNASTSLGNALIIDTSGNVWTSGSNSHGELGQGTTTDLKLFTKVTALSNIASAKLFGGIYGSGYAVTTAGVLWTWGYNGQNQLFKNNTTTPQTTPAAATAVPPGTIAQVFHSRGEQGMATTGQLILVMASGQIAYAGADVGQVPIANTAFPGAYSLIAMPAFILNGSDTITDLFTHGTAQTQRWFILTASGRLFASGSNLDAICAGAATTTAAVANSVWQEITFQA